jgi:hypothetical protein
MIRPALFSSVDFFAKQSAPPACRTRETAPYIRLVQNKRTRGAVFCFSAAPSLRSDPQP